MQKATAKAQSTNAFQRLLWGRWAPLSTISCRSHLGRRRIDKSRSFYMHSRGASGLSSSASSQFLVSPSTDIRASHSRCLLRWQRLKLTTSSRLRLLCRPRTPWTVLEPRYYKSTERNRPLGALQSTSILIHCRRNVSFQGFRLLDFGKQSMLLARTHDDVHHHASLRASHSPAAEHGSYFLWRMPTYGSCCTT